MQNGVYHHFRKINTKTKHQNQIMFGPQLAFAVQNQRDLHHINHREYGNLIKPTLCLLLSHTETSVCQSTTFQNGTFVKSTLRIKPVSSYGGLSHFSSILQSFPITEIVPPEHSFNHLHLPH